MKINSGNGHPPPVDPVGKQDQTSKNGHSAKLRKLCQEFEAIFIHTMYKGMKATIPDGGLLDKGLDSEIMEEMRDLEFSKAISQNQRMGIGEALYRQLSQQETQKAEKSGD